MILGAGAVVGTAILPRWKQRASLETLIRIHTAVFGIVTLVSALTRSYLLLIGALLAGGIALDNVAFAVQRHGAKRGPPVD